MVYFGKAGGEMSNPFDEGQVAKASAALRSSCPYPEGSEERRRWLVGYESDSDVDEYGEPRDE